MITPIMLHNSCTWAAPKNVTEKIEVCQRNHLRIILRIKFPNKISNQELYKRTETSPLVQKIDNSRWKMFGNVLRQPENQPTQKRIGFCINYSKKYPGKKG